jgi:hypothetical protein
MRIAHGIAPTTIAAEPDGARIFRRVEIFVEVDRRVYDIFQVPVVDHAQANEVLSACERASFALQDHQPVIGDSHTSSLVGKIRLELEPRTA